MSTALGVDTHPFLAALNSSARLVQTRHDHGKMTWRLWGQGPTIVLLHGGHGTWRHWAKNIEALSACHTVVAADMPGFGDSDASGAETMADYATTISEGLEQLNVEDGFVLAGFSFGCMVGIAMPDAFWRRIGHFAIVGAPGLGKIHPVITELKSWRRAPPADRNDIHRFNLQRMMLHRPQTIDDLAVEIQTTNTMLTRVAHRTFTLEGAFQARLEHVRPPFSAMWGERDTVVEGLFEPRLALLETIRPGCTVTIVPDAGHWLPYEEPDIVTRHLLAILQDRIASNAASPGGANGL